MITILVVDDDKNTRLYMKSLLKNEGYDVVLANDGKEALECLDQKTIDLMIVDIMMPNIDGYELTDVVRNSYSNMPILMVSAKQKTIDRKMGYLVGIDDYMSKPVDEEEFILKIKALLRRAKINDERKIHIGNVVLDYDSFTVSRKDEVVELPKKEFELLYKLLSYPGKIFTRIQLMDEIWGMDNESGWETVTVHIGRLRKKFENWDEFSIISVRGLGYKGVRNDEK
ncbi:DNA-binding response regulator [Erysipelatoclostridium sp. An15]|uniref:response regulator transcription factor n=1 Tax=Erysipelatoclostridium sp. An15 TaxID=1965566 RepID=UPI000B3840E2|nr:response regulator transcription factor [Erysipelatoclostridium sp. An15]OUQ08189.1 DNA-binding response regulator [Erysipelatoclostridium sp. An15]